MKIQFLSNSEKQSLVKELKEQYGITELNFRLIQSGKNKIRGFSGNLTKQQIQELSKILNIESLGLYLLRKEADIRLSLDFPHLIPDKITKKVIEIPEEKIKPWFKGENIELKKPSGTYIIKSQDDFIGSGKSNKERILNHIPKDRRLKH
jgi:NOL1/NOP2/fmu family ribosome biogenesis protein